MKQWRVYLIVILGLIGVFSYQVSFANDGGMNQSIPYTGLIYDSGGQLLADGDYDISFRLYTDALGGTAIWSEEHDGTTAYNSIVCPELPFRDGRFDVLVGSCNTDELIADYLNNTSLYLEIALDSNEDGTFEETFSPRRRLGSTVSAFNALRLVADGDGNSTSTLGINSSGNLVFTGESSSNGAVTFGLADSSDNNTYTYLSIYDSSNQSNINLKGAGDAFAYATLSLTAEDTVDRAWNLGHRKFAGEENNFFIEEFDGTDFNQRFVISPGGNVGIGTSGPTQRLQVAGTIYSSTGGFRFPDGTTQTTAASGGGGSSLWTANGSNIFYNSGRVGIGTNNPAELLHVNTSGNYATMRFDASNGATGGYFFADHQFGFVVLGSRTNTYTRLVRGGAERIGFDSGEVVINQNGDNNNFRVEGDTQVNMIFGQASTGRVGIGTNSPGYPLSVAGTIHSSTGGFRFPDGTTQTTASTGGSSQWTTSANGIEYTSSNVGIGTGPTTTHRLYVNGNSVFTGNMGIGMSNINGVALSVGGFIYSVSGGYVFPDGTTQTTAATSGGGGSGQWTTSGSNIYYNSGNVAIGTMLASQRLHVNGNALIQGNLELSGFGSGNVSTSSGTYSSFSGSFTTSSGSFTTSTGNFTSNTGVLQVGSGFGSSSYIGTSGFSRVGVGVTNPGVLFQVGSSGDGSQARANAWNTFSDQRWKKDLSPLNNSLDKLSSLNGYYYYWKSGADTSRQIGFMAQDIQEVFPEIVSTGDDGYLSLDYAKMTPLLLEAIKELNQKVTLQSSGFDPSVLSTTELTLAGLTVTGDGRIEGDLTVAGVLNAEGGIRTGIRTVTNSSTITSADSFISANAATGPIVISLPKASLGQEITIKKTDPSVNPIQLTSQGATIDGNTTISITSQYQYLRLINDGQNWFIVGSGSEAEL